MKKVILFDNDGVLVDTEYWYFMATKKALSEIGIELDLPNYLQFMSLGKSNWDLAADAGVDNDTVMAQKARRNNYYQVFIQQEDIQIPGVEAVLAELSRSFLMAIVTTSRKEDFELIHRDKKILKYMQFVLASGDYARSKPQPDPYLAGLKRFGVKKSATLVVEDSARGLKSAVAAGIDCAIVFNEFTSSHDFSAASYQIQSLQELPALLKNLS